MSRFSISDRALSECAPLVGGGSIAADATAAAVVGELVVVAGRSMVQAIDVRTDALAWEAPTGRSLPARPERAVIASIGEDFVVAWETGSRTVADATRYTATGENSRIGLDAYHYDFAAASEAETLWTVRSPNCVARWDLSGVRVQELTDLRAGRRIAVGGDRVAVTLETGNDVHLYSLEDPEAEPRIIETDPSGCLSISDALPHPLNDTFIIGCRAGGVMLGRTTVIRQLSMDGSTTLLHMPATPPWDLAVYDPAS